MLEINYPKVKGISCGDSGHFSSCHRLAVDFKL